MNSGSGKYVAGVPVFGSHCPTCGELYQAMARTPAVPRRCVNGHDWHQCPVHGTLIEGDLTPGSSGGCLCEARRGEAG